MLSPAVFAPLESLVMLNDPRPPCLGSPLGLGALVAPHCVVWDHPLPSQLETAEELKHTDQTKWCLQRNVNVCTRHLQKQADGFPTAPAPANAGSRQPLGIPWIIPLLSQAGSRALWWRVCSLRWDRTGRERFMPSLTHVPEFHTSPYSSTVIPLIQNHKFSTAVLVYFQVVVLGRDSQIRHGSLREWLRNKYELPVCISALLTCCIATSFSWGSDP